jgi:hypothetical protein
MSAELGELTMKLFQWHAELIKRQQVIFGWSDYQVVWLAYLKGLITGALLCWCWLFWV